MSHPNDRFFNLLKIRKYLYHAAKCSVLLTFTFFIIAAFIFSSAKPVYATQEENTFNLTGEPYDIELDIEAESALVMEYNSGSVLWEKNSGRLMYPASTTKMLTAITAIEMIKDFNEITTISKNASGINHSSFAFWKGDKVNLMDLMKASLICSQNNATIAIAEHLCGSVEKFVDIMNEKAKEIGALDTFFENTNGLDSNNNNHKTTAYDLAVIARYSMKNQIFRTIVNTKTDHIIINDKEIEIMNTNKLLDYEYVEGIKTGYTDNAGYCLVVYSKKNDIELITVILNSTKEARDEDALKLIDWVYQNFEIGQIVDKDLIVKEQLIGDEDLSINIGIYPEENYWRLINNDYDKINIDYIMNEDIGLRVKKNEVVGLMKVSLNDVVEKEINLVSRDEIGNYYCSQNLTSDEELRNGKILIFLLSFYFLIFIFIIFRNLLLRKL